MKKCTLVLLSLLGAFLSGCQDHNLGPHPEDVMAWRAGGQGSDSGNSIVVDKDGNRYVTGAFTGTATFGTTSLTATGGPDIFVAKYNQLGEVLWAKKAGGDASDFGIDLALDGSGNLYVIGSFLNTATFGSTILTSAGGSDIFIAKYSSSGEVLWAQRAGGTGFDAGSDIAIDGSGNLYVIGTFLNTATFGSTILTSAGGSDIYIAKYSSSGDLIWVQQAGGTSSDSGQGIAVDATGNVYVTGWFHGPATFGSIILMAIGSADIFTARYNSTGEIQWAKAGGAAQAAGGASLGGIAVDASGNAYVTGSYILSSSTDVFIAKYNAAGNTEWQIFPAGSPGDNHSGRDIAVDKNGNVYVTGVFSVIAAFGFGNPGLTSYGSTDAFVAKFDNQGGLLWNRNAGGTGPDAGMGLALDNMGNLFITGSFDGSGLFGTTTLTSAGSQDIFIARYQQ